MVESASASLSFTQPTGTTYQYDMTLHDTGTTTAGTFWFAWVPAQDFLQTTPLTIADPAGWTHIVTGGGAGNGFAIQWVASSSASYLQAGNSLAGFNFSTTDTPAYVFGNATFHPTTPVLTTFVYSGAPFSDPGVEFVVACFAAGTRILTGQGEVAVESLAAGDLVATVLGGGLATVRWMGHRRIDCARHPRPADIWPIRVCAGAFAPGVPLRDLLLSPDHSVLVDGALIPVRHLVNAATIVQQPVAEVTYWHVELERHDVLLAEGMPAESYLDTGNRAAFANGGTLVLAQPDFALRIWDTQSCAPLRTAGPELAAARARLLQRAVAMGWEQTADPLLHLLADGEIVWPEIDGDLHRFHLDHPAAELRLVSRSVIPADITVERIDHRRIGVAVTRMVVDGAETPINPGSGWHPAEPAWQWTDGNAGLTVGQGRCIELTLRPVVNYWLERTIEGHAAVFLDFAAPHTYKDRARLDVVLSAATLPH